MFKLSLSIFLSATCLQSAFAVEIANKKEMQWLLSMGATYYCSTVCVDYRNSTKVDVKKMIEYGSFENCGTDYEPVACYAVDDANSVNIRHSFEQLVDRCERNGFRKLVAKRTTCELVAIHQDCSRRPEDQNKIAALRCRDIIDWRKPLSTDLIRSGLKTVGAQLAD